MSPYNQPHRQHLSVLVDGYPNVLIVFPVLLDWLMLMLVVLLLIYVHFDRDEPDLYSSY